MAGDRLRCCSTQRGAAGARMVPGPVPGPPSTGGRHRDRCTGAWPDWRLHGYFGFSCVLDDRAAGQEGSAHSRASVASAKGAALATTRTRAHATRVGVPAGAPALALQDSRGPLTVLWGGSRRSYRAPRGGGHAHTQSAVPGGLPTCDERAIGIVTEQCQCSRIRAIKALKRNGGGVVDAIMWQIWVR